MTSRALLISEGLPLPELANSWRYDLTVSESFICKLTNPDGPPPFWSFHTSGHHPPALIIPEPGIRKQLYAPEPAERSRISRSLPCLLTLAHTFLWKPQYRFLFSFPFSLVLPHVATCDMICPFHLKTASIKTFQR